MIHDLENLKKSLDQRYDVCIAGAGAAGITISKKLSDLGLKVILCEAGSKELTEISQKNYIGKVIGDDYFNLDVARLRYLGGTTNHWNGMCRPFEKVDFERDYLGSEFVWPINFKEISKYQNDACKILEINNDFNVDNDYNEKVKHIKFQFSPPVRFKEKYINEISSSQNLTLVLNANLIDIQGSNNFITEAVFENYKKQVFNVKAKKFIFAMGGLENSRYLLWFAKKYESKFFNSNCPIGKYWMEHPHFTLGSALVDNRIVQKTYFSINEVLQKKFKLLNCGFRISKISHKETKNKIKEILCIAPKLGIEFASLFDKNLICGARFFAAWEQEPNVNNAVKLSRNLSKFGIPQIELNWKKTAFDRKTIKQSLKLFNDWLLEENLGRIQLLNWLTNDEKYPEWDELAGYHHMGGTRMSSSFKFGVVDGDCKVHGSKNLYVAGSSIFTTGGHNNPTLPIIQFSLRLADHLFKTKDNIV